MNEETELKISGFPNLGIYSAPKCVVFGFCYSVFFFFNRPTIRHKRVAYAFRHTARKKIATGCVVVYKRNFRFWYLKTIKKTIFEVRQVNKIMREIRKKKKITKRVSFFGKLTEKLTELNVNKCGMAWCWPLYTNVLRKQTNKITSKTTNPNTNNATS